MTEEKKRFEAISSGIADGFKEIGFTLDERDKKIIFFTTIASITIHEKFKEGEIDN